MCVRVGAVRPTAVLTRSGSSGVVLFAAVGLAAGLAVGALARLWMRLISAEHEFTWTGTLFIVLGFGFFGVTQAIAAVAHGRGWGTGRRRAARLLGVLGLLPLFVAAGAIMAPTVVLGGLALWHPAWPAAGRLLLAAAAAVPAVAVTWSLVEDHGASLRALVGACGLVLLYGTVVVMSEGTFSPRATTAR